LPPEDLSFDISAYEKQIFKRPKPRPAQNVVG